jgi:DNA (cytosine-5)-methyltransferase 1
MSETNVPVHPVVRHLDLFSGIGGFALAAQMVGGIETVGFCEIDAWAQKILHKNFPGIPCHDDVKTLDPNDYGRIDLITGGYPCQPFSTAGNRKGESDPRHLWPHMRRVIQEARPTWVLCENVDGHVRQGLDHVLQEMETDGYTVQPLLIPAAGVGARHRRNRVWIIAHRESDGRRQGDANQRGGNARVQARQESGSWDVLDSVWREPLEALFGGEAYGLPDRVDRLRGLGNAIVPQVAAEILRCMMEEDSLTND